MPGRILAMLLLAAVASAQGEMPGARTDADGIPQPLTANPGNPARGREVVIGREAGNCLLCHALPGLRSAGDIGPALAGVGARLSAAQLRLRLADATRLNPATAMPAYFRVDAAADVAAPYRGRSVLDAQQIEDAIAYLQTLKSPAP